MNIPIVSSKGLRGIVDLPGDKSISHRALIIGAVSEGLTEVENCSLAADPMSTLHCVESLGVQVNVSRSSNTVLIHGKGLHGLSQSKTILDAGNSGTTIRLLTGILAGQKFDSEITGDKYLVQRPMKRIIDPLTEMGAQVVGTDKFTQPLKIFAVEQLHPIEYELPLPSAQVKSAILLAGLYAEGETKVIENIPSRDHTERMLGLQCSQHSGKRVVKVDGGMQFSGRKFVVPGDISAAAFFMVAGSIVPYSELVIRDVGLNPTRSGIIGVLQQMGGNLEITNCRGYDEPLGDVVVRSAELHGISLRGEIIPNIIDEVPVLAVAGAVATGKFEVRDVHDLRNKETDRIAAIVRNLRAMGVDVEEYNDGFAFEGGKGLKGTALESYGDHRIAMAFGIAGLVAHGETTILGAECVEISFPKFWHILHQLQ